MTPMEPTTMNMPVLALRGLTVFPHMNLTFDVERPISIAALERAMEGEQDIFLVTQREISVEELADVCKLNRSYFSKLFKDSMGCPPQEFLIRLRLAHAADLMKGTRKSIGDIAARCGYPNQLHFSRAFKKRYGISPREWRLENQIRQTKEIRK